MKRIINLTALIIGGSLLLSSVAHAADAKSETARKHRTKRTQQEVQISQNEQGFLNPIEQGKSKKKPVVKKTKNCPSKTESVLTGKGKGKGKGKKITSLSRRKKPVRLAQTARRVHKRQS